MKKHMFKTPNLYKQPKIKPIAHPRDNDTKYVGEKYLHTGYKISNTDIESFNKLENLIINNLPDFRFKITCKENIYRAHHYITDNYAQSLINMRNWIQNIQQIPILSTITAIYYKKIVDKPYKWNGELITPLPDWIIVIEMNYNFKMKNSASYQSCTELYRIFDSDTKNLSPKQIRNMVASNELTRIPVNETINIIPYSCKIKNQFVELSSASLTNT
jgi:hypothetical protein